MKKILIPLIALFLFVPLFSQAQVRESHLEQQIRALELLLANLRAQLGSSVGRITIPQLPTQDRGRGTAPLYMRIAGPSELGEGERGEWEVEVEGGGSLTLFVDWDDGKEDSRRLRNGEEIELTHRFEDDGEYDILFVLQNSLGRSIERTFTVEVDRSNRRSNRNDRNLEIVDIRPSFGEIGDIVELEVWGFDSNDDEDDIEVFFDRSRIAARNVDVNFSGRNRAFIAFEIPRDMDEGRYRIWIEVDGDESNEVTFRVED